MSVHHLPPSPVASGRARLFSLHRQATAQVGFDEVRVLPPKLAEQLRRDAAQSLMPRGPGTRPRKGWLGRIALWSRGL